MHFTNLLIIVVVAFLAPLVVNALPAVRVPSPVLEILTGIVLGPSVLGWVHIDVPVQVLALIGLAFLLFLAGLALVAVLLTVALIRAGRSVRIDRVFQKLMDTTAQIRIRFAMVLLVVFLALAQGLGFEAILGAFLAGAVLRLIDADAATVHPHTEVKLDAIGYGFLIPVFFVTSGVMFDAKALFASSSALLQVPLFLAALFAVRALPALLYRSELGMRHTMTAGFLQATSLPFIVAAVQIGQRLGALPPASGAALIAAGLASVLLFPAIALAVMRTAVPTPTPAPTTTRALA